MASALCRRLTGACEYADARGMILADASPIRRSSAFERRQGRGYRHQVEYFANTIFSLYFSRFTSTLLIRAAYGPEMITGEEVDFAASLS